MAINVNGIGSFTGLLGYDREYKYLGDSTLPFRIVDKYTYTATDYDLTNREDLAASFKTKFANQMNLFENDITVTSLTFPNSSDHMDSKVEFQKYTISLEVYSQGSFANTSADGYENSKNQGLSTGVGFPDIITSLSDDFSFNQDNNDKKNYGHNVSITMQTGEGYTDFEALKTVATDIARDLFDNEPSNLSDISFGSYSDFSNSGTARNYYTESFDKFAFSFDFTKTREIETVKTGTFDYSVSHSVNFDENGIFNIQEKLTVCGKKTFQQATQGYDTLKQDALARCETALSDYTPVANLSNPNWTFYANLINMRESVTYNEPEIKVESTLSYTNDESQLSNLKKVEKFSVARSKVGVIEISHGIDYSLTNYLTGDTDSVPVSGANSMMGVFSTDRDGSYDEVKTIHDSLLTNLSGVSTGIVRTKSSFEAPERGKTFRANFSYSDDPSYDTTRYVNPYTQATVTGFNRLSIDYQETEPADSLNEYKVINRPTQNSIIHYGYQQTPGTFSVNINGKAKRNGNMFTVTPLPTVDTLNLLEYSNKVFLDNAIVNTGIYTYFLRDYRYNMDSNRSFSLSVQYEYFRKKYGNIS